LRYIITELQSGLQKINFYNSMLRELKRLTDFFIDQPLGEMIGLKTVKEIQDKFSTLDADF